MFQNYKKIAYPIYDENNNLIYEKSVTDITVSYSIRTIKTKDTNQQFFYQEYELEEYETPMSLSSKLYGTPKYYWVLMQINNIINPYTDWFMNSNMLRNYTIKKYKVSIPDFEHFLQLYFNNKTNQSILDSIKFKYKEDYIASSEYQDFIYRFQEFKKFRDEEILNSIHHFENIDTGEIITDYYASTYFENPSLIPLYINAVSNFEYEYAENLKKKIIKVFNKKQLNTFLETVESII